jgi:hypothetical protein
VQRFASESLEGLPVGLIDPALECDPEDGDRRLGGERTRQWLDWQPVHPSLIEDLDHGHYFDE